MCKWGGHWRPDADYVHFQIDCHPDELRQGIVGQSAVEHDTTMVSEVASTKRASVEFDLPYLARGQGAPVRCAPCRRYSAPDPRWRSTDPSARTPTRRCEKLQAAAALDVDGVVGPDTWRALLEM